MAYRVRLVNYPAEGTFDGTSGIFATWITINDENKKLTYVSQYVTRGIKMLKSSSAAFFDSNNHQIIYLKKGDRLSVRFKTYGTSNMNDNTNNVYINKKQSIIKLWKL